MKLPFITILLSLPFPLLPAAAAPATTTDPRAADAAYVPPAEVKTTRAKMGELVETRLHSSAADHTYRVATAAAHKPLPDVSPAAQANVEIIFSTLAAIAQHPEFQGHDPLYVLERARQQLQQHEQYGKLRGNFDPLRRIIEPRLDSLGLLEKFLMREWCGAARGRQVIPGMSQAETIQHENFLAMSRDPRQGPQVIGEINALYEANVKKNIETCRKQLQNLYSDKDRPVPSVVWNIIVGYTANHQTQWGCSIEQAYAMHQKLHGAHERPTNNLYLSGYGIISTRGFQGKHLGCVMLDGNLIQTLPRTAFEFTAEAMWLGRNPIESIAPGAFINQTQLDNLHLNNTPLSRLNAGTFAGLHFLEQLNLAGCGLEQIAFEVFDELYCLQALYILDGNTVEIPYQRLREHCCMPFLAKRFFDEYEMRAGPYRYHRKGDPLYYISNNPVYISPCRFLEHLRHLDTQNKLVSKEFERLATQAFSILTKIHIARAEYDKWGRENWRAAANWAALLAAKRDRDQHLPTIIAAMKSLINGLAPAPLPVDDTPAAPLLPSSEENSGCCCTVS